MLYHVKHKEKYSQGELLLRSMFGIIYIGIPHMFVILFLSIGLMFVRFVTFWSILITGKFPKNMFDYQVKFMRYQLRVNARLSNIAEGYPQFGLSGTDTETDFNMPYREEISRGTLLVRAFFGVFLIIPHFFALPFRAIGSAFVSMIAFWIMLFTGKYPKNMFDFVVGTGRWGYRIQCYLNFYTDNYPAFSGLVQPEDEVSNDDDRISDPDLLDDI